jgi:hypothetical protein
MLLGQLWIMTVGLLQEWAVKKAVTGDRSRRLDEHNRMLAGLHRPGLPIGVNDPPETFVMLDHLRLCMPDEAMRLAKVRAERRYCQCIGCGAVLLALVNLCLLRRTPSTERAVWEIALAAVAAICWLRSSRLTKWVANGISAAWLCLVSGWRLPFRLATGCCDDTSGVASWPAYGVQRSPSRPAPRS